MLKFNEYSLITENLNQMKSLFVKNTGQELTDIIINANSDEYKLLQVLIGTDNKYTKLCTDPKIQATYGDNIKINEEKERSMRSYLGMFTKMYYDENCSLDTIKSIVYYILANKATINKLPVKNNITGETEILPNLLDIFKFKDIVKASGDNRPAYEIITDAIRDKDKSSAVLDFINLMPSVLRRRFRDNEVYFKMISDSFNTYQSLDDELKKTIYKSFFGGDGKPGKISRYKSPDDFIEDFNTLIENGDTFNIDVIKNEILKTRGAKLIECNYEENYIVADIWTYKASTILGEPSSWCISYKTDNSYWFNSYMDLSKRRKMFFIWNFNMTLSEPMSKLGANIHNNGEPYLVCDKNDKSISDDIFIKYLDDNNINKAFLNIPISKEEEEYRMNDALYKNLSTYKMFDSITAENIQTELPKILNIIKNEEIEVGVSLLLDALDVKHQTVSDDAIYHILNKFLDTIGTEKYEKDLFTRFLIKLIFSNEIEVNELELYKLYEKLGNNINYDVLNKMFYQSHVQILNKLPKLYNIIKEHATKTFYDNQENRSLFFYLSNANDLDTNFEKLFNIEDISSFGHEILDTILGEKTQHNFLQKLNDLGHEFTIKIRSKKAKDTTGFYATKYSITNYEQIIDSLYNNDEININDLKGLLILNSDKINNLIEISDRRYILNKIIPLYLKTGLDISNLNFEIKITDAWREYMYTTEVFREHFGIFLELIADDKIILESGVYGEFFKDLFKNKYYSVYKDSIYDIMTNKKVKVTNNSYMSFTEYLSDISNIQLAILMLDNDLYSMNIIKSFILSDNKELIDKSLIKIITNENIDDIINDFILNNQVSEYVKNYCIENILDFSNAKLSSYISASEPKFVNMLLDKNIQYEDALLTNLINYGHLTIYDQETIKLIDHLAHTGYIKKPYNDDSKFYLNDLDIIKFLIKKIPGFIDTIKLYKIDYTGILKTLDMDKIKFFKNIGVVTEYKEIDDYDYNPSYCFDINVINYLLEESNNTMTDKTYTIIFRLCKDLETFKYFFNKYKNFLSNNVLNGIIETFLVHNPYSGVLDYLKTEIPDLLKEVVMEHYEENKRSKIYTDSIREWIKNNYYTKQKVKKIREMFEIFKNLVKY